MSKSQLSDFAKSPALWYGRLVGTIPHKQSASFVLGSATDKLWVEQLPLSPENGFQLIPKINPMTGKPMPATGKVRGEYIAHVREQGMEPISHTVELKAEAMRDALDGNERALRLRSGALAQVSLVWRCPHTKLMLKGRPDLVNFERMLLSDLKTTKEIRPHSFDSDASAYNYHWQLHLYTQGLAANGCGEHWRQWLITVRNEAPHGVACRPLGAAALELAEAETAYHLRRWLQCRNDNHWPADLLDEKPIDMPRWRYREAT
jgi:hypothetical protein